MGWSIGYDEKWKRDIGYGVPATCDHPDCDASIDRGLSHVCGGQPYGGEHGCGLYFCGEHLLYAIRDDEGTQLCEMCPDERGEFLPKPDVAEWVQWKETDDSWAQWRAERNAENQTKKEKD